MNNVGLVALAALSLAGTLSSQEALDHNGYLRAGTAAAAAGDPEGYHANLRLAWDVVPDGNINRPFIQYHFARASAMTGNTDDVFAAFDAMWHERIESLMMVFAAYDAAFDPVRDDPRFERAFARFAELEVAATHLAGPVYQLEGAGCYMIASVGDDGVLLVDAGYHPALPAVRRAVASLGSDDIRYVVVTHAHEDHMGAAPDLMETAQVLAHPRARETMREGFEFIEGVDVPPRPESALPDVEVAIARSLQVNGEEVLVIPLPAHSGGDLIVYFTGSRVLHMGDDYFPGQTPYLNPGPDPRAYLRTLGDLLSSMPDDAVVVSGHDPVTPVSDLRALFERTRVAVALVADGIAAGLSQEEILRSGDQGEAEQRYLGYFYRLLTAN